MTVGDQEVFLIKQLWLILGCPTDDNGIVGEQGRRQWPYSAFVRKPWQQHLYDKRFLDTSSSLFFSFSSHCSEVALVLYIWHLVTVTLIWFDFYLTTELMSICRHVGELAPSILPPDLDIQPLSNSYLIKVIMWHFSFYFWPLLAVLPALANFLVNAFLEVFEASILLIWWLWKFQTYI